MPQTVLVLVPHPDDAEFGAGGTIARLARAGARVLIVIATDGSKGALEADHDTLAQRRTEEARRAAAVLGAEPPIMLGHPDLELDTLPPGRLREQFIRLIRCFRPDVVIAQDPATPGEKHPDHCVAAWAAAEAVAFAHLPNLHPEHLAEGLAPHFVTEKYFFRAPAADQNKLVDITDTLEVKLAALAEHRSQIEAIVKEVAWHASLAGLDPQILVGAAQEDPMQLVGEWVRARAAEVGLQLGVPYAEAFRYQRYHPVVEALLGAGKK